MHSGSHREIKMKSTGRKPMLRFFQEFLRENEQLNTVPPHSDLVLTLTVRHYLAFGHRTGSNIFQWKNTSGKLSLMLFMGEHSQTSASLTKHDL